MAVSGFITGKRAVVTGGARPDGIGWATAEALVSGGYQVVVTGATDDEVAASPGHESITAAVLDVRDDVAVSTFFAGLERLDALVTCAGAASAQREFTAEGFATIVDINLTGTMRCCLAAQSLLASSGGTIVTVGSMYSIFGSGVVPGYSASKGGVVQLTRSLAVAWGPKIRVNAVLPGWIRTSMGQASLDDEASGARILQRTPAERFGAPDDLAQVIGFLCSPASAFVTGAVIPVDGGYHCSG